MPRIATSAFPQRLPVYRVERDDAGIWLPTDHHDEFAVLQQRRAADSKKGLRHFPFFRGIALPDEFTIGKIEAIQFALRAESVATVGRKHRRAARPIVVTIEVAEVAGVLVLPL